jgi:type IV secretion system protein VirB11
MTVHARHIYLESYLAPLAPFLARTDVTDIYINRPGEVWLEAYGSAIERHFVPELTHETLQRLVRQIAALSAQGISRQHPLLAAALPSGERVQIVFPPATRGDVAIAIRKQIVADLRLDDFAGANDLAPRSPGSASARAQPEELTLPGGDIASVLRCAVRERRTILICGGTSSGKTTLLNSLLREIPEEERLIFIEDTPELVIGHENAVGLVAARGTLREADVDTNDLLVASLRMRPDRIILGEVRGPEAITFLRAINTGHPGSMTTVHANSCDGAIEQLAFLALQGGLNLDWNALLSYIRSSIDIVINVKRRQGIVEIDSVNLVKSWWPATR